VRFNNGGRCVMLGRGSGVYHLRRKSGSLDCSRRCRWLNYGGCSAVKSNAVDANAAGWLGC
jgi:hypothetical protein